MTYAVGYTTDLEPVEEAYFRTDAFISNILIATDATDYKVFLSDSSENNFRYKIDPQYKAQRTQPKPVHYDAIKEYLITKHGAKIAHNREADDELGVAQTKANYKSGVLRQGYPTIICSIDKDLGQIPGYHYSWPITRKGEVVREGRIFEITEDEGLRFYWSQLLIGDKSDNIFGIDGLGPKKTEKLFEGVPTNELFYIVAEQYEKQYGEEEWAVKLVKNSKLLWIKRSEGESEETPVEYYIRNTNEVSSSLEQAV